MPPRRKSSYAILDLFLNYILCMHRCQAAIRLGQLLCLWQPKNPEWSKQLLTCHPSCGPWHGGHHCRRRPWSARWPAASLFRTVVASHRCIQDHARMQAKSGMLTKNCMCLRCWMACMLSLSTGWDQGHTPAPSMINASCQQLSPRCATQLCLTALFHSSPGLVKIQALRSPNLVVCR